LKACADAIAGAAHGPDRPTGREPKLRALAFRSHNAIPSAATAKQAMELTRTLIGLSAQSIRRPPLTSTVAPVMYVAPGPARKATTWATSSAVAKRPHGIA